MAQKRKTDQTKTIITTALALAGKRGWDGFTVADVAKSAKITVMAVEKAFPDVWAIMEAALRGLEAETLDIVRGHLGDNWRDNLMEILMTRFELAQAQRDAYLAVAPAVVRHPVLVKRFAKSFFRTMERMLSEAGAPVGKKTAPLATAATAALFLSLVHAWREDATPDLSRTMAAIDKRTGLLEQALDFLATGRR